MRRRRRPVRRVVDHHRRDRERHHRGPVDRSGRPSGSATSPTSPTPRRSVGLQAGIFEENLPDNVTLEPISFNAGPEAIEALFADGLDISYIGPNPAINAYAQSDGEAVRIIAGSTSGGAFLVVRDGIDTRRGPRRHQARHARSSATPRTSPSAATSDQGYRPTPPAAATSRSRRCPTPTRWRPSWPATIDGAWVPEPFATRYIQEGGAPRPRRRARPAGGRPTASTSRRT